MVDNIKKIMNYSFTDLDLKHYLGDDAKILQYKDLKTYKTLDELLPKEEDFAVILIETAKKSGHWCCLIKSYGLLEWWDSYGYDIDKEFSCIPTFIQFRLHESNRDLSKLIDSSPLECRYNDKQLQSRKDFVSTCGRWVVWRLLQWKRGMDLGKFLRYLDFLKSQNDLKGDLAYDVLCIREIPYMGFENNEV